MNNFFLDSTEAFLLEESGQAARVGFYQVSKSSLSKSTQQNLSF
jgi:hypothetical protein